LSEAVHTAAEGGSALDNSWKYSTPAMLASKTINRYFISFARKTGLPPGYYPFPREGDASRAQ